MMMMMMTMTMTVMIYVMFLAWRSQRRCHCRAPRLPSHSHLASAQVAMMMMKKKMKRQRRADKKGEDGGRQDPVAIFTVSTHANAVSLLGGRPAFLRRAEGGRLSGFRLRPVWSRFRPLRSSFFRLRRGARRSASSFARRSASPFSRRWPGPWSNPCEESMRVPTGTSRRRLSLPPADFSVVLLARFSGQTAATL